jgi:shikimate dehydrogenase
MPRFGLIGYPLSHSFSGRYFAEKFARLGLSDTHRYDLFPLPELAALPGLLADIPDLRGLNVTIPYKQEVLAYLDELSPAAEQIGAVNTIDIRDGRRVGHNTDVIGFRTDLLDLLGADRPERALVLGTGGAARAVGWVLEALAIPATFVSRSPAAGQLHYAELDAPLMQQHRLVVNTTPLGMSPRVETKPDIPYSAIDANHYLYDLVYNPAETAFMAAGKAQGARTRNGLAMLTLQADAAWEIWTAT